MYTCTCSGRKKKEIVYTGTLILYMTLWDSPCNVHLNFQCLINQSMLIPIVILLSSFQWVPPTREVSCTVAYCMCIHVDNVQHCTHLKYMYSDMYIVCASTCTCMCMC